MEQSLNTSRTGDPRTMARNPSSQHERHAGEVRRDSITVLRGHFDPGLLRRWAAAFAPLLEAQVRRETAANRGAARHYVTLPFDGLFADPAIFADEDILAIV